MLSSLLGRRKMIENMLISLLKIIIIMEVVLGRKAVADFRQYIGLCSIYDVYIPHLTQ